MASLMVKELTVKISKSTVKISKSTVLYYTPGIRNNQCIIALEIMYPLYYYILLWIRCPFELVRKIRNPYSVLRVTLAVLEY